MLFDSDKVKRLIKEGVKQTLSSFVSVNKTNDIYAFALCDAEGYHLSPALNTESCYQGVTKNEGLESSPERFKFRWSVPEWSYENCSDYEKGLFAEIRTILAETEYDGDNYLSFHAQSFGTSILALKELVDERFFTSLGNSITVFFQLSDAAASAWLELESARRLNSKKLFAAFEPEWRIYATECWGDVECPNELLEQLKREFPLLWYGSSHKKCPTDVVRNLHRTINYCDERRNASY